MKKIALLGLHPTSRNQGVQALCMSILDMVSESGAISEVSILTSGSPRSIAEQFPDYLRRYGVTVVGLQLSPFSSPFRNRLTVFFLCVLYRLLPIAKFRSKVREYTPWIQEALSSSLVADIRGGDSFSDIYGWRRFILGSISAISVLALEIPLIQLPQTIGPFKSTLARTIARFILLHSHKIFVRDSASAELVQQLTNARRSAILCPDVAFTLKASPPTDALLEYREILDSPDGVVGINISGLLYFGSLNSSNPFGLAVNYNTLLKSIIQLFLNHTRHKILLIPHTYGSIKDPESDNFASEQMMAQVFQTDRVSVLRGQFPPDQIKYVIGKTSFFVGSRMHACIGALSQGVPTCAIAYSSKFVGVFATVGAESLVLDARTCTMDSAMAKVVSLYRERENLGVHLKVGSHVRAQIRSTLIGILDSEE